MDKYEAIKELEEDKALYMPEEWVESIDRDTPDGRLITALEMAINALKGGKAPGAAEPGTITLKPCPFCGSKAETSGRTITSWGPEGKKEFNFTSWLVRCTNKKCFYNGIRASAFMDEFLTEEDAAKEWNERHQPSEQERWRNGE